MGYPFGNNMEVSQGKIIKISQNEFGYNCDTNLGFSGSFIILAVNLNVIEIHKAGDNSEKINVGTFIGYFVSLTMTKEIIADNRAYYNNEYKIHNNMNYKNNNIKTNIVQYNNLINNNNYIMPGFSINEIINMRLLKDIMVNLILKRI